MEPIRLLIADDIEQVRRDLATVLELASAGAGLALSIVGEAANGLEAVEKAVELEPGVILMDLAMPGLDGYQATQEIKAALPQTRVIALTIHGGIESRQAAREAGVDAFLEKGVPIRELLFTVMGC